MAVQEGVILGWNAAGLANWIGGAGVPAQPTPAAASQPGCRQNERGWAGLISIECTVFRADLTERCLSYPNHLAREAPTQIQLQLQLQIDPSH